MSSLEFFNLFSQFFLVVALLTMRLLSAGTQSADLDSDDLDGPELTAAGRKQTCSSKFSE